MIRIENENMELKGTEADLMADLYMIIRGLHRAFCENFDASVTEELIRHVVDDALKDERPVPLATVNFTDEFMKEFLKKVIGE